MHLLSNGTADLTVAKRSQYHGRARLPLQRSLTRLVTSLNQSPAEALNLPISVWDVRGEAWTLHLVCSHGLLEAPRQESCTGVGTLELLHPLRPRPHLRRRLHRQLRHIILPLHPLPPALIIVLVRRRPGLPRPTAPRILLHTPPRPLLLAAVAAAAGWSRARLPPPRHCRPLSLQAAPVAVLSLLPLLPPQAL